MKNILFILALLSTTFFFSPRQAQPIAAWTQMGLDIDGEAEEDYSGNSVSLFSDGGRVAIGAYWNRDNGSEAGHVRVYEWNDPDGIEE